MVNAPFVIEKPYRCAYDNHGFLRYDERPGHALAFWVVQDHPDFQAAFDTHGDRTRVGLDRTIAMLQRRGWRQPRPKHPRRAARRGSVRNSLVALDAATIAGWTSSEAALANEFDHAWLPTAHAGVVARIESGEPEIDPAMFPGISLLMSPVRRTTYKNERFHAWTRSTKTLVRVTPHPIILFGDQPEDIRRRIAPALLTAGVVDPRWMPVVSGHAHEGRSDLPMPLTVPPGEWRKAIEHMLGFAGVGSIEAPDLDGRLDSIAERHLLMSKRIADGRQQDHVLSPERRRARDLIVAHGGATDGEQAPADVHRIIAREASALARSVRLYRWQSPPGPAQPKPTPDPLI